MRKHGRKLLSMIMAASVAGAALAGCSGSTGAGATTAAQGESGTAQTEETTVGQGETGTSQSGETEAASGQAGDAKAGTYEAAEKGFGGDVTVTVTVDESGKVTAVDRDPKSGFVVALSTDRGERIEGELFIDCSGFRALLIGEALGAPFEDWSHWLPCDRAVAAPCARSRETTPYTRSTLRPAGWQWRIPLQHRTGNGYVYASAFISDDEAASTLLANLDGELLAEPRFLRFKAGFRRESWRGNVVAIGLSAGFLEPLESTSIHLIQSGIAKLISLFPDRDCDPSLARQFNALFGRDMDGIRDFLILHYHATEQHDQPLWRQARAMAAPDSLSEKIAHYRRSGRLMLSQDELFREASWLAVLEGQGIVAQGYAPLADTLDPASNRRRLDDLAALIARAAPTLPNHDAVIAELVGG